MFSFVLLLLATYVCCSYARDPLKELFHLISDENELLTVAQYGVLKSALEEELYPADLSDDPQLKEMIGQLDGNDDHVIDETEFLSHYAKLSNPWFNGSALPEQIRVAYGPTVDSMRINWVSLITDNTTLPPQPAQAIVKLGTESGNLNMTYEGSSHTYDVGLFGGWHGWISDVSIAKLNTGTKYYYVVSNGQNAISPEYSFTTATDLNDNTPTSFACMGDAGTIIPAGFEVSNLMAKHLHSTDVTKNFDFVAHVGDLCYATLLFGDFHEWEYTWDLWGRQNAEISQYVPYMTTVGNHEKPYNFTSYKNRLHMPGDEQVGALDNFWFTYTDGNIFYISISTEDDYSPGSPQYVWLVDQLERYSATKDWLVVGGHRPMYSSEVDENSSHSVGSAFQTQIEPLMIKYGVDVYVSGHQHGYERSCPMQNGTCVSGQISSLYNNPKVPFHVVLGTGGVFLDYPKKAWVQPQPDWSYERTGTKWGYGHFTAHNATHMEYTFYDLHDVAYDHVWLVKDAKSHTVIKL